MRLAFLAFLVIPVILLLGGLYLWHVGRAMNCIPAEAADLLPHRWNTTEVEETTRQISSKPLDILPYLPPSTGRKYIVVGGAGFVGGWIVRHLLLRGEDPKKIRIVGRRPSFSRQDMRSGKETEVAFVSGDIRDLHSIRQAFLAPWPDSEQEKTNNLKGERKYPEGLVQVAKDEVEPGSNARLKHYEFFSNYAYTKYLAEQLVREADSLEKGFRTGCLRPGGPIYGTGGDLSVESYLIRGVNPSWASSFVQPLTYVENASYGHLLYEQRLLEALSAPQDAGLQRLGGQTYLITDDGHPVQLKDVFSAVSTLTHNEVRFPSVPAAAMLGLAHLVESYYVLQARWLRIFPEMKGQLTQLQPSIFNVTNVHWRIDDSRARRPPAEGGLGYQPPWMTLQGVCYVVNAHLKSSPPPNTPLDPGIV